MTNRTFGFIKKNRLGPEAIVLAVDEEKVQSFAEANFGRKLSDLELSKFSDEAWENDEALGGLADLMRAVIKKITKNEIEN